MAKSREVVENEIIDAATKIFVAKGFKGATMRDIASEAGINLAMLNYYFRSKENLFDIIFDKAFTQMYGNVFGVLASNMSVFDKIRGMVNGFIEVLIKNPSFPSFIFWEISINPDRLVTKIKNHTETEKLFNSFQKQIDKEEKAGIIKPTSLVDIFMNIDALCAFPFIAKPMFTNIFNISDINFGVLMERRKTMVAELLIDGLRK